MRLMFVVLALVIGCDTGERPAKPAPLPPPPVPTVPVAFAVVFEASEVTLGNDDYEPDENARYQGVLKGLARAFERLPPAATLPEGSKGMLIAAASEVRVLAPMGPIENLNPRTFGRQIDYDGETGDHEDVMAGVELATRELAKVDARRRLLWVFGYFSSSTIEESRARLAALQPELDRLGIELEHTSFKTHGEALVPRSMTVNSVTAIEGELRRVLSQH